MAEALAAPRTGTVLHAPGAVQASPLPSASACGRGHSSGKLAKASLRGEGQGEGSDAERLSRNLEAVFTKIERERMRDVPILNPALSVACVGMRLFEDAWLSVLVTPWFINLIALPAGEAGAAAWGRSPAGSKSMRRFPAGPFEFISASEDGIGPYQMCSLFSPVLEFENQEAALATAEACLGAVFDAGLDPANEGAPKQTPGAAEQSKQEAPKLSRRALIFGTNKSKETTS